MAVEAAAAMTTIAGMAGMAVGVVAGAAAAP